MKPETVRLSDLRLAELLELERRVVDSHGPNDPTAELLAAALPEDDEGLERAAAAAARVRLGEHPCSKCRRRDSETEIPLKNASRHLAGHADWRALEVLAELERAGLVDLSNACVTITRPPGTHLAASLKSISGIRWAVDAAARLAAFEETAPPHRPFFA